MTIARDQNNNKCKVKILHTTNSAYQQRLAAELQAFHHRTLSAPKVSTLTKSVKTDQLLSFPGLTLKGIKRHLPKSVVTLMGHFDKYRQGIRSTKEKIKELMSEDDDKDKIELEPPRQITDRKHYVRIECIPFEDLHEKLKILLQRTKRDGFQLHQQEETRQLW